jgi:hypothetical protein
MEALIPWIPQRALARRSRSVIALKVRDASVEK